MTGSRLDATEIARELTALESASRLLEERLAVDPKAEIVAEVVERRRGMRGLVFTQSRDTARALWSSLRATTRCGIVTGSGSRDATGKAAPMSAVFGMLATGRLELIVATDVGCEGLNLQAAAFVVHADLPWSPARLEQRVGRVSRIGQKSTRVEEVILVAEGSPVEAALKRKSEAAGRFAGRRTDGGRYGTGWTISERLIVDSDEQRCVVNLAERRAGRSSFALRPLDIRGSAGPARDGREIRFELEVRAARPANGRDKAVELAVDAWVAIVRRRELQPPRLDGSSPQHRMIEAAARAGVLTRDLVELMALRYRAGTEMLIARAAGDRVDATVVAALVRAIAEEGREKEPYEASIAGSIVTRGWLRAAEGFAAGGGYNRPVCR